MRQSPHNHPKRIAAQTLALCFSGIELISPALSATTDLADSPMAVTNAVKPNIMFILDNSGSMDWRSITGTDALNEYSDNETEFYSSTYNQIWYDPNTTYTPGIDRTSFSSTNTTGSLLNPSTPATAPNNPYLSGAGTTDLTPTCYYSGTTPPLKPTIGGNCRASATGSYTQGPIAVKAFYYVYSGTGSLTTDSNYSRQDILPTTTSYIRNTTRTDCGTGSTTVTCNYTQEIQNFANWWTYYRTRILTMKTTMGLVFAGLSDKYRVGFSTINNSTSTGNNTGANFILIGDFDYSKKLTWFTQLYSIDPANGTPLQRALQRVGEYYAGNSMGYSSNNSTDDPVQYSCQHNYAILSTDGFWNSNTVTLGNRDTTVPTLPVAVTGLTAGSSFPKPYYDSTSTSNTLSDVAMYYWATDLRTTGTKSANNVSANTVDPATWQHMTTFTIGLGADGSKDYRDDYLTATTNNWYYNNLLNGTDNWPAPVADANTAIDDLWHAAVNGRGQYFNAKHPTTLKTSLQRVLEDIIARSASAAAVAVASTDVSIDNTSYASTYNSGTWDGQLGAYPIDQVTGVVSATALWTARDQLDTLSQTSRRIVTRAANSNAGIQFQPAAASTATKLSTAQQNLLNSTTTPPGPSDGADVLAYIRGDRSKEGANGDYRTRAHLLGDIINAEPVLVSTPVFSYGDAGYAAFKLANTVGATGVTRVKTVFQGANDGMIHALDGATGAESWAYIPSFLLSSLNQLTKKQGFVHKYYVDTTPINGDVDFNHTSGSTISTPDWRTLLVGGLGKGGSGYYALDVTTPTASDEADAASKVQWEFPSSTTSGNFNVTTPAGYTASGLTFAANMMGYTYGRPIITKTRAYGWVVLVTSGYNNGDGRGFLFVLNAQTGAILHVFNTSVGSSTSPSGLTYISGFSANAQYDNTIEQAYGGDLNGNVWRFDLSSATPSNWSVQKLAALVDPSGNAQPVTSELELATATINGAAKRLVFVGTGKYLGQTDVPGVVGANSNATQVQTMYGLVDDLSATPLISPLRSNLQAQTLVTSGSTRTITGQSMNWTTQRGWYIDLPAQERITAAPALAIGMLYFTSNTPNTDPCSPGGSSWLTIVNYVSGTQLPGSSYASISLGNVLASRPITIQTIDGSIKAIVRTSDSLTPTTPLPYTPPTIRTRRASWKEVPNQ